MSTTEKIIEKTVIEALPLNRTWYKLYFAKGINPRGELIFEHEINLQSAIQRSREHCDKMNYKFIRCEPFLVNLDEVEKRFERES